MGGHALTHKRAEHFLIPPSKLVIIGYDTDHVEGEHDLWRFDCKHEPEESFINSVRKHGVMQPVRARKIDDDTAEVVMGRERVKAARIIEAEGVTIKIPTLLWPAGTPSAEIIGAANAENFQRKTESTEAVAAHIYMQMKAEGYGDGIDELACAKAVSMSTGLSVQRIRNLLAFREDDRLVRAVRSFSIGAESALAIATLPEAERGAELARIIADPTLGTVAQVRERVSIKKAGAKETARATRAVHNGVSHVAAETASGISKPLQKRIVAAQIELETEDRLDPLVIKTLKVCAGLAAPSTVPGLTKALKALGL